MDILFSNKFYFTKLVFCLLLITAGCFYSYLKGTKMEITLEECLSNPIQYNGTFLSLYDGQIIEVENKGVQYFVEGRTIFVRGANHIADNDRLIDIQAKFNKEGYLEFDSFRYSNKVPLVFKKLISAVAIILVAIMFFRDYRLDIKKFSIFSERT